MTRTLRRGVIALGALASIAAAPVPAPSVPDSHGADRVRATVEFLADDQLEGRGTGTRGHALAAAYVASEFRALGLAPGGEKGGWYEQVPLRTAEAAGPTVVELIAPNGRRTVLPVGDVSIGPSLAEARQDVTAPLAFAGYGISAPTLGRDDYRGVDVRGRIAVVLSGTPAGISPEVAAHLDHSKDAMAAAHGAIGVIIVPADRLSRAQWGYGDDGPVTDWVDRDGRAGDDPPGLRLAASATPRGAAALFKGAAQDYATVAAARDPRGFTLAARIHVNRISRWHDFTSPEVIGRIDGADPALRGQYVVLMAHLDHLGLSDDPRPGVDRIYNGALDNAAGVATMIEAAHSFAAGGVRPKRSILFIANTGEEKGLLGAGYFAAHPTVPAGSIAAVVDLDMPLPLYDFTDVTAYGADHSTVARTVTKAAATMGINVAPDPMPEEAIFVRSDHYRFVTRGVPAILLATGFGNGGAAVWRRWMKTTYHQVGDDLSQPIRWDQLARYAELNFRIARALADDPQRPRWYRGDFFGDTFAPGQAQAER